MNNLYKSIKMAALAVVAVVGLIGCKDKTDLLAIDAQLAQKTLQGIYVYVDIDSVAMNTTLYEWSLEETADGRIGYYRVASTGNDLDGDVVTALTWEEPTMAEDGLSMTIPVEVGGEKKNLLWQDGVLTVDGYVTSKNIISMANILRSVHENFTTFDFVHDDTTSYITSYQDTLYFLGWKTQVVEYTQEEIDAYKQFLIDNADTLRWFNENYPLQAVPDTVRFSTTPTASGKYKGVIPVAAETSEIKTIKVNNGPLSINNGEMIFSKIETAQTGSYVFHKRTWTQECYTHPTDTTAKTEDVYYEITDAKWTPLDFINTKKFSVLFKGKVTSKVVATCAGETIKDETKEEEEGYIVVPLSGFSKADGEVTANELKYKNKE